jgi:hypothetical protein
VMVLSRSRGNIGGIAAQLRQQRREFQSAVRWLCSPKPILPNEPNRERDKCQHRQHTQEELLMSGRSHDGAREEPLNFLEDHGLRHIKIRAQMAGDRIYTYFEFRHWIDIFCSFLLGECCGRRPCEMPIKLCRLCGRLFVPERSDAEYCKEGGCQRKSYWTDERHRDYEYVRRYLRIAEDCISRRHGFRIADLQGILKKPKVKNKLRDIEQRWKNWPKITEQIKRLRKLGAS